MTRRTRLPQAEHTEHAHGAAERGVPEATVARLPLYLRALAALADRGVVTVSSD